MDDRVVEGRVTVVELRGLDGVDGRGLGVDGPRRTTTRLRVELPLSPLDPQEDDDLGTERLVLGAGLRVGALVEKLRVDGADRLRLNALDRDGVLTRGLTDRLGAAERREIELLLRDGIDGRGLGREIDRLGADRVTCRLGALARLLEDRPRDDPPSAASASNRTAATAAAATARPGLEVSFKKIITYLLSPAASLSGNPELPFPPSRRRLTHHSRSCDTYLSSYTLEWAKKP